MMVTKGLVIDTPWIDQILAGKKTWEMRSRATSQRGWIGLIRKGSGQVVGLARLDDCGPTLSRHEMLATIDKHGIPERHIADGAGAKWTTPWKFGEVKRLAPPVPYRHKLGAVTWVLLDDLVGMAINRQFEAASPPSSDITSAVALEENDSVQSPSGHSIGQKENAVKSPAPRSPAASSRSTLVGDTELNQTNLDNSHFYMSGFIGRFPANLIGGGNKRDQAPMSAIIDWGGPEPAETDIDGKKQFFRKRAWVKRFFADNDAVPGDKVRVEETAPYAYLVRLIKRGSI
ncbi:ASCH domain-containing protein [Rhodoblastus acidophilus]|uniref:ASCH domain-containing protein n=1 Tax=Rhodoblastus acidophilus TaxID=1074 RepID=A0A6N8DMJ1_RHOAC|nr:ASCH domain-containing protein [Rhodoblastus acidophilus]MCW2275305.1 hypothetical protein [Rhodoblastus acidophilus]MTV31802.1 ASCH domain-containing protein [Rhodoblastus acidophilus]